MLKRLLTVMLMTVAPWLGDAGAVDGRAAPALDARPEVWINSAPLDWAALSGKVVLLNVWTYGCGNCKRSLPWLKSLRAQFAARGFEIVGVHSPEFDWERPRSAVAAAVTQHGIAWPVMLDDGLRYWDALGNRYWPAFYLVDRHGRIAGRFYGETHADDAQARHMERLIDRLLREPWTVRRS